jgi:rubrerythrin
MTDEYIRLDTTIMGIDGLINEAPTGSQARALLCAKDMIYDQQRYASEMKPVKRGKWDGYICSECNVCADYFISGDFYFDEKPNFCPNCGADMRGDTD